MEHQLSFADSEYQNKRLQTRKEKFLGRMEALMPWQRLASVIEPHYPKPGNGRRPYPLMTMLRIHCYSNGTASAIRLWKMHSTKSH